MSRCAHLTIVLGLLLISGFSTGCASILGGSSHKKIFFTSNPVGANVEIYDKAGEEVAHGVTPFTADLKRGWKYFVPANYTVKCALGSDRKESEIHSSINPWYFGNILFGGLIGMGIVDPLTGAMWDPEGKIYFNFADGSATVASTPPSTSAPPYAAPAYPAPAYASTPPLYAPNPASLPAIYTPLPPEAQ